MPLDPVTFTVDDVESDAASLTVTATSSNQVDRARRESDRSAAAARRGPSPPCRSSACAAMTTITLTVSDGQRSSSTTFTLTVTERTYYLAEGATGPFFDTDILIANPNAHRGADRDHVPEGRRHVDRADAHAGGDVADDDSRRRSRRPRRRLLLDHRHLDGRTSDRRRTHDAVGCDGLWRAHGEGDGRRGVRVVFRRRRARASSSTYFLLANPHAAANTAHVTYFAGRRALALRATIRSRRARGRRSGTALMRSCAIRRSGRIVTFDLPGVAERAMYFGDDPLWLGGHASAGATAPVDELVPRGRRDGRLLHDVRADRESE